MPRRPATRFKRARGAGPGGGCGHRYSRASPYSRVAAGNASRVSVASSSAWPLAYVPIPPPARSGVGGTARGSVAVLPEHKRTGVVRTVGRRVQPTALGSGVGLPSKKQSLAKSSYLNLLIPRCDARRRRDRPKQYQRRGAHRKGASGHASPKRGFGRSVVVPDGFPKPGEVLDFGQGAGHAVYRRRDLPQALQALPPLCRRHHPTSMPYIPSPPLCQTPPPSFLGLATPAETDLERLHPPTRSCRYPAAPTGLRCCLLVA